MKIKYREVERMSHRMENLNHLFEADEDLAALQARLLEECKLLLSKQ